MSPSLCIWCLRPADVLKTPHMVVVDGSRCCDDWCARAYAQYTNKCLPVDLNSKHRAPHFGLLLGFGGNYTSVEYQSLKSEELVDRPSSKLLVPFCVAPNNSQLDARLQQVTNGFYNCLRRVYKTEASMQEALVQYHGGDPPIAP